MSFYQLKGDISILPGIGHFYFALTFEEFRRCWGEREPSIVPSWESNWERIIPFFDYSPEIRKVIYTTNAIESLNNSLRRVLKGRRAFPSNEAIRKLIYLGINHATKRWNVSIWDWKEAMNQFIIMYGDRVPV